MLACICRKSAFGTVEQHLLDLLAIHWLFLHQVSLFGLEGLSQVPLFLNGELELASRGMAQWKRKLGLVLGTGEHFMNGLDRALGR